MPSSLKTRPAALSPCSDSPRGSHRGPCSGVVSHWAGRVSLVGGGQTARAAHLAHSTRSFARRPRARGASRQGGGGGPRWAARPGVHTARPVRLTEQSFARPLGSGTHARVGAGTDAPGSRHRRQVRLVRQQHHPPRRSSAPASRGGALAAALASARALEPHARTAAKARAALATRRALMTWRVGHGMMGMRVSA